MPSSTYQVSWLAEANRSANDFDRQGGALGGVGEADRRVGRPVDHRRFECSTADASATVGPDQVRGRLERLLRSERVGSGGGDDVVRLLDERGQIRPCLVGLGPVTAQAERVRVVLVGGAVGRDRDDRERGVGDVRRVLVLDRTEQVVLLGKAQQRLDAGFADRALQHVRQERAGIDLDLRALLDHATVAGDEQPRKGREVVVDGDEAAHRADLQDDVVGTGRVLDAVGAGVAGCRVRRRGGDRGEGFAGGRLGGGVDVESSPQRSQPEGEERCDGDEGEGDASLHACSDVAASSCGSRRGGRR